MTLGILKAAALVVLVTALGEAVDPYLQPHGLVMFYLLGVVVAALRWGRWPAAAASALSVLLLNFFFVPPRYTLHVHETEYYLTFLALLCVGVVVSELTGRLRETMDRQAALAAERLRLAEEARRVEVLVEAERLHTALLNTISHDLQTPIASIQGALESLEDPELELDRETVLSLVHTAREQTRRLNRLVANLLEMTRMEAGATRLRREPLDVGDLVGTALQRAEEAYPGRTFTAEVPPDLPLLNGDFVLLVQVLVNLLENAAKYSPAGAPVRMAAEALDGEVAVRVADQGPGIPREDRRRVFDKFYRADRTDGTAGSGLGLAICKGLVEAHGGTIEAGDGPAGGTIMTVRLPVVRPAAPLRP